MFDRLLSMAGELRAGLQDRLLKSIREGLVQGALLEVDRYWYLSALRELVTSHPPFDFNPWNNRLIEWVQSETVFRSISLRWDHRPPDWDEYCRTKGYVSSEGGATDPVIIRVLLREQLAGQKIISGSSAYVLHAKKVDYQRLFDLPRRYLNHPIVYEIRPPAIASSFLDNIPQGLTSFFRKPKSNAINVGRAKPNTSGTLGGKLRDVTSGVDYLVSCAHVLGTKDTLVLSPGPTRGRKGTPIGRVRFSVIPPLKPANEACSLHTDPQAGRLDLAVAELQSSGERFDLKPPDRIRNIERIHRFQSVTFTGIASGTVNAQINAATVWQELITRPFSNDDEGFRCFGDIFELAGLAGDEGPIAADEDSGAWIFDQVDGLKSWNGILIGKQGDRAYGCFAEHVMGALINPDFPNGLSLAS